MDTARNKEHEWTTGKIGIKSANEITALNECGIPNYEHFTARRECPWLKKKKYIKIFKGKRSIMSALIINVSEKKVNLGDTCTNTERRV